MGESALSAFSYLLAYSVLMFTVPFLGFFGTRTCVRTYFGPTEQFTEIVLSVGVSVMSMFVVMGFYVRHAFYTTRLDADEAELNKQD